MLKKRLQAITRSAFFKILFDVVFSSTSRLFNSSFPSYFTATTVLVFLFTPMKFTFHCPQIPCDLLKFMKSVRFETLTAVLLLQSFEGSYCCHRQSSAFQEALLLLLLLLLLLFECITVKMKEIVLFETSEVFVERHGVTSQKT